MSDDWRDVRFASVAEMFDTRFKPPATLGVLADRCETNACRFWANYALLSVALMMGFGLRIGLWMAIALVGSHASFKTRTLKEKVAKFFE